MYVANRARAKEAERSLAMMRILTPGQRAAKFSERCCQHGSKISAEDGGKFMISRQPPTRRVDAGQHCSGCATRTRLTGDGLLDHARRSRQLAAELARIRARGRPSRRWTGLTAPDLADYWAAASLGGWGLGGLGGSLGGEGSGVWEASGLGGPEVWEVSGATFPRRGLGGSGLRVPAAPAAPAPADPADPAHPAAQHSSSSSITRGDAPRRYAQRPLPAATATASTARPSNPRSAAAAAQQQQLLLQRQKIAHRRWGTSAQQTAPLRFGQAPPGIKVEGGPKVEE